MTADVVKGMVATRFAKAVNIGLVVIVGVWHLGLDTLLVLGAGRCTSRGPPPRAPGWPSRSS